MWARRIGQNSWQFPQGGIRENESIEQALYRELEEEVGLLPGDVSILARSQDWLRYHLPKHLIRRNKRPLCIGQKQRWFLLRMLAEDEQVCLSRGRKPEFDDWRWVHYWQPLKEIVFFKRHVYRQALDEFAPLLFPEQRPSRGRR